jgi:CDGSH-type Zn-finger protein
MSEPQMAGTAPIAVDVQAGTTYWWCACGASKHQPWCDGSHRGGPQVPVKLVAERDERLWFCACKRSARAPLCDGSHRGLEVTQ